MIDLLAATTSSVTSIPLGITKEGNWFLQNAWLIPLIPALSFVGILFLRLNESYETNERSFFYE